MTLDIPRYTLNDGQSVPVIGFGTYPLRGDDGVEAMVHALEAGYRLLDTAVNYGNEEEVGEAVRRSGLPREDVQVTSKIPGRHHEHDKAIGSVEESLRRLRFDYLDRVLIHWPNPRVGRYVEAWGALVELRNLACLDLEELHMELHLALGRVRKRLALVRSFFEGAGLTLKT